MRRVTAVILLLAGIAFAASAGANAIASGTGGDSGIPEIAEHRFDSAALSPRRVAERQEDAR